MVRMPGTGHLLSVIYRPLSFIRRNTTRILITSFITLAIVSSGIGAVRLRRYMVARLTAPKPSYEPFTVLESTPSGPKDSALALASASGNVLGTQDSTDISPTPGTAGSYNPPAVRIPTAAPNPSPFPTLIPLPTTTASAPLNCAGTANAEYSQVYLSTHTAQTGTAVTVSVELRDCKNTLNSEDWMNVSLQAGDAQARINGQPFPQRLQAKSGKASFTVTSPVAGTVTMLITDTNQNFPVTEPGYKHPSITFTTTATTVNANCTTGPGIPNAWYSNVYPDPPLATGTGAIELIIDLRDCYKAVAPVSDSITVSLQSGDSAAKINGQPLPYTLKTSNGGARFTLSSNANGTVTLIVRDTTHNFTVTNTKNQNPSIEFRTTATNPSPTTGTTATATPAPTASQLTPTATSAAPSPTPTVIQSPTPTVT